MARTYRRDPYHLWKGKTFRDGHKTIKETPGWFVGMYMNKPKRRQNTRLCYEVMQGKDHEDFAWPTGNHKPHIYYW
ncbi:MAG: hypothetical protein ACRBDL_06130 [Alphaproteobacteria bacterium]